MIIMTKEKISNSPQKVFYVTPSPTGEIGSVSTPTVPMLRHKDLVDIILQYSFTNGYSWYAKSPSVEQEETKKEILDAVIQAIMSYIYSHQTEYPCYNLEFLETFIRLYFSEDTTALAQDPLLNDPIYQKLLNDLQTRVTEQFKVCKITPPTSPIIAQDLAPICKNTATIGSDYKIVINSNITLLCKTQDQTIYRIEANWNYGEKEAKNAGKDCIRWYFATHQLSDILERYQMGYSIPITSNSIHFQNAAMQEAKRIIQTYKKSSNPYYKALFQRYAKPNDSQFDEICVTQFSPTTASPGFFSTPCQALVPSAPPMVEVMSSQNLQQDPTSRNEDNNSSNPNMHK